MIEEMTRRLDDIESQLSLLVKERQILRDKIAKASTEFKVGDWVTLANGSIVWELRRVVMGKYGKIVFYGAKIKRDGTPGVIVKEIWEAGYHQLIKWEAEK